MGNRKIKLLLRRNLFFNIFKLVRASNLLIIAFMEYFIRIFLIGPSKEYLNLITEPEIFYLTICTVMIAAGGYIINDYYDIKIDMVNKPKRVILNKKISRRTGLAMHIILNTTAVVLAYFKLSINVAIFMAVCSILLWWYSHTLKRTVIFGNLCIAFLAGASIFMLWLYYGKNLHYIILFTIFAFIITIIREIIKDMEDVKGDKEFGCRTIPILYGIPKTKIILYFLILISTVSLLFSFIFINIPLYVFLFIFSIIPFIILYIKLYQADTPKHFNSLSGMVKFMMIAGIVGMVLV